MKKLPLLLILSLLTTTLYAANQYRTRSNPWTGKPDYILGTDSLEVTDLVASDEVTGVIVQATTRYDLGSGGIASMTITATNNLTFYDPATGYKTLADLATSGGGESTTVSDTTTINLTLTGSNITADGLYTAGDGISLTGADFDIDYNTTNLKITTNQLNTIQDIATSSSPTFTSLITTNTVTGITVDTQNLSNSLGTEIYSDTNLNMPTDNLTVSGIVATGIVDFGGATSTEVENAAGDVTLAEAGAIGVDTTNKQFVAYDGTTEFAIPLRKIAQGTFDLAAQWDVDSDLWLIDLHADSYPNGIYITAIYVDCTVADPTTELDANLMYCDAVAGGAFPGANATLIKAIDTTTGNFSDAAVNIAVATGKSLYIDLDADPTDATTQYHIRIHYRIEED